MRECEWFGASLRCVHVILICLSAHKNEHYKVSPVFFVRMFICVATMSKQILKLPTSDGSC